MNLIKRSINLDRLLKIGEFRAPHGIKGWVKVYSFTRPKETLFNYKKWLIGEGNDWYDIVIEEVNEQIKNSLLAKLNGVDDRNAALKLTGMTIAIEQTQLETLETGEYYWSQLIGLDVVNTQAEKLGQVKDMLETGANDVFVVINEQGEQLIPYGPSIVHKVDLERGQLVVDWEMDES